MRIVQIIGLALLPVLVQNADAGSLRCNHRLISEGMSQSEVMLHCGEPMEILVIQEPVATQAFSQTEFYPAPGQGSGIINTVVTEPLYRDIERWTYFPGSGKLIREVDFLAGKVLRISTLGRAP